VTLLIAALALAGSGGFLAATALGTGAQSKAKTVTINVATGPAGPPGPAGPQGPPGPAGSSSFCPAGFSPGELIINHPGGQTVTWTCLHD